MVGFGIQTDWKKIYLTMNKDSDALLQFVSELLKFLESKPTVPLDLNQLMWSVVEKTALAEAESEYHEKKSKAIYCINFL